MGNVEKVNIAQKFALFNEYWVPYIVGELNDSYVKVDKLKGQFVWHKHDGEDELFALNSPSFSSNMLTCASTTSSADFSFIASELRNA